MDFKPIHLLGQTAKSTILELKILNLRLHHDKDRLKNNHLHVLVDALALISVLADRHHNHIFMDHHRILMKLQTISLCLAKQNF